MTQDYKALESQLREIFKNDSINIDSSLKKDGTLEFSQVSWTDGPTADLMNWHLCKSNLVTQYLERGLSKKAGERIVKQLLSEGFKLSQFTFDVNDGQLTSIFPESNAPDGLEDRIDYLIENYQEVPESAIPHFESDNSPEM